MQQPFCDRDLRHLFYRFKCGSVSARNDLIVMLLPLLKSTAYKVLGRPGADIFDDLVQDACMHLLRVLDKFQASRAGVKMTTWVVTVAQNRMKHYIRSLRKRKNGVTVVVRDFTALSKRESFSPNFKKLFLLDPDFIDLARVKPDLTIENQEVKQASKEALNGVMENGLIGSKHKRVLTALAEGKSLKDLPEFAGRSRAYCSLHKKEAIREARRFAKMMYQQRFQSLSADRVES